MKSSKEQIIKIEVNSKIFMIWWKNHTILSHKFFLWFLTDYFMMQDIGIFQF
jgi:hypothetical protein